MAPKKKHQIRLELIGSKVTTKKHPSPILLDDTKECLELCANLGLDVFQTPDTIEQDPKTNPE
jgi:hypothetical protein